MVCTQEEREERVAERSALLVWEMERARWAAARRVSSSGEEEEEEKEEGEAMTVEEGGVAREIVLERARMARDSRSFCCWEMPRSYHAWALEGSRRTAASAWRTDYGKASERVFFFVVSGTSHDTSRQRSKEETIPPMVLHPS
jgi:hypothetical protein